MSFFGKRKELAVPPAVSGDAKAVELIRVWAAHGKQHVSLRPTVWDDPAAWGICLVDLARHLAKAYSLEAGKNSNDVLQRIKEGFDAEWSSPTDEAAGTMLD